MSAQLDPRPQRRAMTVSDLDAVTAIEVSSYAFPWTRGNFVDSLAAGYLAEVLSLRRGPLLGYVIAMGGVDEMHLLNLTVAPAVQGQGLGSSLLEAVTAHARQRGLAALWLEVRQSNERARALYQRRGFSEVGRRRGYYPAGGGRREDAIVMRLPVEVVRSHALD